MPFRRRKPTVCLNSPHLGIRAWTFILLLGWLIGTSWLSATPVYAKTISRIVSDTSVTIEQHQTVNDVVVIGHALHVIGTITDTALVVNGDVYVSPTGRAQSIIDIGGKIYRAHGAVLRNVYTLTFSKALWNSTVLGLAVVIVWWSLRMAVSLAIVVIPVLMTMGLTPWMKQSVIPLETSGRRIALTGLLGSIAALGLIGLSALSIVGMPLAILLAILYGCVGMAGLAPVSVWIGNRLSSSLEAPKPLWIQSLIGSIAMMAVANIPMVGLLFAGILWMLGVGTVMALGLQWRTRMRQRFKWVRK